MTAVRERSVATSDASGNITFVWPPVPTGFTWYVAVIIPNAPPTATAFIYLTGQKAVQCLGPQPSAGVEVVQGQKLEVKGVTFAHTTEYYALAIGSIFPGAPQGVIPTGPSTLTKIAKSTAVINILYSTLPATPRHMIARKVALKGLTVPTDRVKILGTLSAETLKVGIALTWWPTNKGKVIYYAAGGTTQGVSTSSDWISATTSFKFFPFGGLTTFEVLGTTGDFVGATWL